MIAKKDDIVQFCNCYLLRDNEIIKDDLWVRNRKIINPEKLFFEEKLTSNIQIDCGGAIICPGLIDVQINGAFGVDFSLPSNNFKNDVQKVSKGLLAHGVTSFCPTVVTSKPCDYLKILPNICRKNGSSDGAGILGIHVEGPFINAEKKGAHPVECISSFDHGISDLINTYGSLENVLVVTLAPELKNATDIIKYLTDKDIIVSVGHSMANLQQGEEAFEAGATLITHLFNAMLPFHHRDPHLVGLIADNELKESGKLYYGIIADGVHTHPASLRIAYRTNSKGIILVTDAVPAMGLPPGRHHIGHQEVDVLSNGAYIAGTNTLCGSTINLLECVKFFHKATGCSIIEALNAASLHPAKLLHIEKKKGTLNYNSDADFILLDDDLNIHSTYIGGQQVWKDSTVKDHCIKYKR